jgi:hypothetical protein
MDLREIGWDSFNWIDLAIAPIAHVSGRGICSSRVLVNMVVNLRVP